MLQTRQNLLTLQIRLLKTRLLQSRMPRLHPKTHRAMEQLHPLIAQCRPLRTRRRLPRIRPRMAQSLLPIRRRLLKTRHRTILLLRHRMPHPHLQPRQAIQPTQLSPALILLRLLQTQLLLARFQLPRIQLHRIHQALLHQTALIQQNQQPTHRHRPITQQTHLLRVERVLQTKHRTPQRTLPQRPPQDYCSRLSLSALVETSSSLCQIPMRSRQLRWSLPR